MAGEEGDREGYLRELRGMQKPLADETLSDFLTNPAIPAAVRRETVFEIARRAGLRSSLARFLGFVLEKGRLAFFPEIVEQYERLLQRELGQTPVRILSARPLEADERERLLAKLRRAIGEKIVVHMDVDPTLIGGMQIEMAGRIYDGTLRGRLEAMKERIAFSST
jgi:F-type H+-transporting ATPase subunit delta